MARNYQYGTSPRKIEPDYIPNKKKAPKVKNKPQKIVKNKKVIKHEIDQKNEELKQKKKMYHRNIAIVLIVFLVLLAVSYRNSLITEKFNELQNKKSELASIEKTNGQLEVNIEGSLNLNNVEKSAQEKLGMQKLQNDQKVYVSLPKEDYTEPAVKEVKEEKETTWFQDLLNTLGSLFK